MHEEIISAYRSCGFYILEGVIAGEELAELRADVERLLERAPVAPDVQVDARGRPAAGADLAGPMFALARPLSDPFGGTTRNSGRHEVKMEEPAPVAGAPEYVVYNIGSQLQLGDAFLRLYGHPRLLRVAEGINGRTSPRSRSRSSSSSRGSGPPSPGIRTGPRTGTAPTSTRTPTASTFWPSSTAARRATGCG